MVNILGEPGCLLSENIYSVKKYKAYFVFVSVVSKKLIILFKLDNLLSLYVYEVLTLNTQTRMHTRSYIPKCVQ